MAKEAGNRGRRDREETPEFSDRLVAINRVSKTVKGGKTIWICGFGGCWRSERSCWVW
jgi:ribosomal protein S5